LKKLFGEKTSSLVFLIGLNALLRSDMECSYLFMFSHNALALLSQPWKVDHVS